MDELELLQINIVTAGVPARAEKRPAEYAPFSPITTAIRPDTAREAPAPKAEYRAQPASLVTVNFAQVVTYHPANMKFGIAATRLQFGRGDASSILVAEPYHLLRMFRQHIVGQSSVVGWALELSTQPDDQLTAHQRFLLTEYAAYVKIVHEYMHDAAPAPASE
jgi:hypothetical protein